MKRIASAVFGSNSFSQRSSSEVRKELDVLGERSGITLQEDWYSIPKRRLKSHTKTLRTNQLHKLLSFAYPEFEWKPFLFRAEIHFWKSKENQRSALDWIGEQLGIHQQEDWYKLTGKELHEKGIDSVLTIHNDSLFQTLQFVYSEYEWNPLLFRNVPHHFWKHNSNQRKLMDWISEQFDIKTQEDWYALTAQDVKKVAGKGPCGYYNNSLASTLAAVYPEFEWNPLLFRSGQLTSKQREKRRIHRQRLDSIGTQLGVEQQEDWYLVTPKLIKRSGGRDILNAYNNSLFSVLKFVYREFHWNPLRFPSLPHNSIHLDRQQDELQTLLTESLQFAQSEEGLLPISSIGEVFLNSLNRLKAQGFFIHTDDFKTPIAPSHRWKLVEVDCWI